MESRLEAGLLQAALDLSPACIILVEAPSGKIIYTNKSARNFSGKTNTSTVGITLDQYVRSWRTKYPDGALMKSEDMSLAQTLSHGEMVTHEKVVVLLEHGQEKSVLLSSAPIYDNAGTIIAGIVLWLDVTACKVDELGFHQARNELHTLNGILPICVYCKNIRDDRRGWRRIESYLRDHSAAQFTHGICSDCMKKHYADVDESEEPPL
ncbi:hypothetical protein DSLASN_13730 [Desulfoluna limicola]|uniref:PAS fold-4 domain-containing protein n=1 Tax=Desulfoluna limicola TaxID=2810562 RepID=A0ABM7PDY9_9BACT|nr:hypothetical protein DSLASN_13730 [Desulfoluna limicola]